MGETGIVVEELKQKVKVRIPHSERCRGCHACEFITKEAVMEVVALNRCDARKGDRVEIAIAHNGQLPATLILYGIPVVVFVLSLVLLLRFLPELYALLGALAAITLCYLIVKAVSKKMDTAKYLPAAVRVISPEEAEAPSENTPEAPNQSEESRP